MKNYDAPSAGSGGNYGAPTPHAAAVAHDLFVAPEADLNDNANNCWPVAEDGHTWTSTPGE